MNRQLFQFISFNVKRKFIRFNSNNTSDNMKIKKIGFIGLGNMGLPMCKNLLKKGFDVTVNDINEKTLEVMKKEGAKVINNPSELAEKVDCLVTMLPASPQLQDLYINKNGISRNIKPGTIVVDCSTIDPSTSQQLGKHIKEIKSQFYDAPVSGGISAAQNGTLTFMVGGEVEKMSTITPLLSAMGTRIIYCGPVGSGQIAKICNNLLLGITMFGLSESMALGIGMGLDPKILASVINTSSGRCWSSDTYNPIPNVMENVPSTNDYKAGFASLMIKKDLEIASRAAELIGVKLNLGKHTLDKYKEICDKGLGGKDFSVIYKYISEK